MQMTVCAVIGYFAQCWTETWLVLSDWELKGRLVENQNKSVSVGSQGEVPELMRVVLPLPEFTFTVTVLVCLPESGRNTQIAKSFKNIIGVTEHCIIVSYWEGHGSNKEKNKT